MKLTLSEIESCIQALEFELAGDFMSDLDEKTSQRIADVHRIASEKLKTERDRLIARRQSKLRRTSDED